MGASVPNRSMGRLLCRPILQYKRTNRFGYSRKAPCLTFLSFHKKKDGGFQNCFAQVTLASSLSRELKSYVMRREANLDFFHLVKQRNFLLAAHHIPMGMSLGILLVSSDMNLASFFTRVGSPVRHLIMKQNRNIFSNHRVVPRGSTFLCSEAHQRS